MVGKSGIRKNVHKYWWECKNWQRRCDASERAEKMRSRLRQKITKKKQYRVRFDRYKDATLIKITI